MRGLLYRADAEAIVDVLNSDRQRPQYSLQMTGDLVLVAVDGHGPAVEDAARRIATELRERDWEGDEELALQIEAAYGWVPVPLLRPQPVDLDAFSSVLEGDPALGGGRLELATGEAWPETVFDEAYTGIPYDEEADAPDRWLRVHCLGSRESYRDMERFIDTVDDERLAERLWRAIQGRGAFRRFKDVLYDWPEHQEHQERWYAFNEDRHRGRARAWLVAEGYAPVPPRRDL
ncbi:hypothetical protein RPIT_07225 [Tessaracoccus flavus]|uniref:Uncharacterized protein n=1 Tax=Tessaracoccus flavus TaxID=1610493 RepID=A0A1Q2CET2_9ACTN|nr:hypothetical protein RPIT_07225 [Tessaracoccus flavus]